MITGKSRYVAILFRSHYTIFCGERRWGKQDTIVVIRRLPTEMPYRLICRQLARRLRKSEDYRHSPRSSPFAVSPQMQRSPVACLDDTHVHESDLASLGPYQFVDDVILEFHSALLNRMSPDYFCVSPCVSQLISRFSPASVINEIAHLGIPERSAVFFPVVASEANQLKHWSLLVWRPHVHRGFTRFYHFDSGGQINFAPAKQLAHAITTLFGIPHSKFRNIRSPTQVNGYDCGIYVMAITEYLLAGLPPGEKMVNALNPSFIAEFRMRFHAFLRSFRSNPKYEYQMSSSVSTEFCEPL
jgi:sentrin-specific protease 8